MYLNAIERTGGDFAGEDSYLQDIPAIKGLSLLELRQPVTFLVGENGQRQVHFAGGRGPGPGVQSRRGLPELRLFHPGHPLWAVQLSAAAPGPLPPQGRVFPPGGELLQYRYGSGAAGRERTVLSVQFLAKLRRQVVAPPVPRGELSQPGAQPGSGDRASTCWTNPKRPSPPPGS